MLVFGSFDHKSSVHQISSKLRRVNLGRGIKRIVSVHEHDNLHCSTLPPHVCKKQHVFVFCSFLSFFPIHHGWVTRTKTERLIIRPKSYHLGFPILLRNCQDKAWISFWDPKFEGRCLTPNEDRTGTDIEQWTFRRTPKLPGCDRDYEVTDRKERWYKQSKYYVLIQKDGLSVPKKVKQGNSQLCSLKTSLE